jgi:hypothetical protein
VIGSATFAWNANSETAVLKNDVKDLKDAKLPERFGKLEEKVDGIKEDVQDVRDSQRDMATQMNQFIKEQRALNYPRPAR